MIPCIGGVGCSLLARLNALNAYHVQLMVQPNSNVTSGPLAAVVSYTTKAQDAYIYGKAKIPGVILVGSRLEAPIGTVY